MIEITIEDLERRVNQFNALELPGQPKSIHMGTSYLVADLWKKVKELRDELEDIADRGRELNTLT